MRAYQAILNEARLMASSPERVFDYFKERASTPDLDIFKLETDYNLEVELLSRDEPLINMALARYALYSDVATKLFKRFYSVGDRDSIAVTLGVLSNQVVSVFHYSNADFPQYLFDSKEKLSEWINKAKDYEIDALFKNPNLGGGFLSQFLKGNECWQQLSDDRQLDIVISLSKNPRLAAHYVWPADPPGNQDYIRVFNAAWELANSAPRTFFWALRLSELYEQMLKSGTRANITISHPRWYPNKEDVDFAEFMKEEAESNLHGQLSAFQKLRKTLIGSQGISIQTILGSKGVHKKCKFLESDDLATRCAVYSYGDLNSEQLHDAFKRDAALAFHQMLDNPLLWFAPTTKQTMHDISRCQEVKEKHGLLWAGRYDNKEKEMDKRYPNRVAEI